MIVTDNLVVLSLGYPEAELNLRPVFQLQEITRQNSFGMPAAVVRVFDLAETVVPDTKVGATTNLGIVRV